MTPHTLHISHSPDLSTDLQLRQQVDDLNRRAEESHLRLQDQVERLARHALELAAPDGLAQPRYPAGAALALQTLGRHFMARNDNQNALCYFEDALEIFERENPLQRETAVCRSYIGVVWCQMGDYSNSAEVLRRALREADAIGDLLLTAEICNDLSYVYLQAGEPRLALNLVQKSIVEFRQIGDELRLAWALETLGRAKGMIGIPQEGLICVLEGMALAEKNEVWFDVIRFKQSAGEMYHALGDFDHALEMFEQELIFARRFNYPAEQCSALYSKADLLLETGRIDEALTLLQGALSISGEIEALPLLRECFRLLARAYKMKGDFERALDFHERFHQADRAIYNEEADQRMKNLQVLYQLENAQREAEIYQLRAQTLQKEVDERKRSAEVLELMARIDPLTEILNRRAFFEQAEQILAQAHADEQPLAMILIDVDHFKQVNDNFGHQTGDRALTLTAERMRRHIRNSDLLGRYGGEEFIVLLPGLDSEQALVSAERLRCAVAAQPMQIHTHSLLITLSLGVVVAAAQNLPPRLDEMVNQADCALYVAKQRGRNCSVLFRPEFEQNNCTDTPPAASGG